MKKASVLFLCMHNSCRSQMAEGLLRSMAGDRFEVASAGLEPQEVNPLAVRVMQEIGIDISKQRSKDVKDFLTRHFGYLITVCDETDEKCPTLPGIAARLHWPFIDPAKQAGSEEIRLIIFRMVRDQIKAKIAEWLGRLDAD